jgi:hypothetical protein
MSRSTIDRRAVLAGAAAVPAAAIPVIALASGEPDPIFEAIQKHRDLWLQSATASRACVNAEEAADQEHDPRPYHGHEHELEAWERRNNLSELIAERERLGAEEASAAVELTNIAPTTMAGVLALIDYVDSFDRGELEICADWCSHWELWPCNIFAEELLDRRGKPINLPFHGWIMRNIEIALRDLTGAA